MTLFVIAIALLCFLTIAWKLGLFDDLPPQQKPRARRRQLPLPPSPPSSPPKSTPRTLEPYEQGTQTQVRQPKPPVTELRVVPKIKPLARLPSLSHIRNVREGDRVLNRLRLETSLAEEKLPIVIGTLRGISPYVFEELLLTCCQEQGWQIKRNFSYSRDGGIDGRVMIVGKVYVLQAKRYRGYIKPEHVREFYQAIQQERAAGGFFLHCGKTGQQSKQYIEKFRIKLISGQRLVDLILGKPVRIVGVTINVSP